MNPLARVACVALLSTGSMLGVSAQAADPSGYETLKGVLGEQDMDAFKARWEAFVANLTFN